MFAQEKLMTVEELAKLPPDQSRGELIRGEFFSMSPAGHSHGSIASNILLFIASFVREHKTGKTYAAETGFILARNPDTVRAPDAAFVRAERLADQPATGFFEGAPDLAVEVISPSETVDEVESKVIDYLGAGSALVWLIYPRTQTATVYRSLTDIEILTIEDTLTGGDLLPGFSVSLKEIFE
jgi:Uma2 family endonuclease